MYIELVIGKAGTWTWINCTFSTFQISEDKNQAKDYQGSTQAIHRHYTEQEIEMQQRAAEPRLRSVGTPLWGWKPQGKRPEKAMP